MQRGFYHRLLAQVAYRRSPPGSALRAFGRGRCRPAEMTLNLVRQAAAAAACGLLLAAAGPVLAQGVGAPRGAWPTYGGDLANTRYSELAQIDAANFEQLEVAWRFRTDNLGPRPEFNFQSTPLVVDGVLYSTAGTRRAVVALDAGSGELLWIYRLDEGARGEAAPRRLSGRGLAYWADGEDRRIVFVTPGYRLIALDARTGRPVAGFGDGGIVDLKRQADQVIDPIESDIGLQAAPIIAADVIVVGAAHAPGVAPRSMRNTKGFVRGYDVRTGRRLWIFHTVPLAGQFGAETWLGDSREYTGNTGAWGQMSADEELGLVYVPTEAPTNDAYGGHRPGDNLFSDSILALDIRTGERRWHFQTVHHDIWDWDLPCAPILTDINVDGRTIRALAQPTKQGFLFVLDRATGEPVWPIEERPVPAGDVPGEWYSPTQPFPTRPPAFERQGVTLDDLIDFTPELRAEAEALVADYNIGPIFTPPVVSRFPGPQATIQLPRPTGGPNWGGGALDPATNMFYIFSNTSPWGMGLVHAPEHTDLDWVQGLALDPAAGGRESAIFRFPRLTVQGLPIIKPPWGRITAIDLAAGEIAWQVPHGETADNVRDHPALRGLDIPRTGRLGRLGTLVTKTLVIAGDGGTFTDAGGVHGARLRAYDKATGRELGAVYLPAPQTGSPMTYELDGQQYLVLAVSGAGYSGELLAFRLPRS